MLLCRICLLRDSPKHTFYHKTYIYYFVECYEFLLSYNWSPGRCFVLLLKEIQFPFLCHVQVFPSAILSIRRLFFVLFCFVFSCFCFQVLVVLMFVHMLLFLLLATVINLFLLFLKYTLAPCLDASTPYAMLTRLLLLFLTQYNLFISPLWCKTLCIGINFPIFWSICLSFFLVDFKNCPDYYMTPCTFFYTSVCW